MSSPAPEADAERFATLKEHFQNHMQEHVRTLEWQLTHSQQRQRDHVEEELHKMRQQLMVLAREQQQQHQTTLAACREAIEALRRDVTEALHRLSQDVDRIAQQNDIKVERSFSRLHHEIQAMLRERDQKTVMTDKLGELFIALGKQLRHSGKEPQS